jgi:AcrR family transcriptional regulator
MDSKKSRVDRPRGALEPRRRRGELRVASLLAAAAEVIAERGYEAATMAEIAARAGARIGSLYRFFPSKEVLADALIQRYRELVDEAFGKIEDRVAVLSIGDLADALVGFLAALHGESRAVVALLDARSEWSAKRAEFRQAALRRIAQILRLRSPQLRPKAAEDVAAVLLHNMKTMKALTLEPGTAAGSGVVAELREMNRLYLEHKLSRD